MPKLIHASIPADDPAAVARFFAALLEGDAYPFPPGGPDAWVAWAGDSSVQLEVVRRGSLLHRGTAEAEWRKEAEQARGSEVHLALAVERSAEIVIELAERQGWPARLCWRGGDIFPLVEVWIEGAFLVEVFDPSQREIFEERVTRESWARLHEPA